MKKLFSNAEERIAYFNHVVKISKLRYGDSVESMSKATFSAISRWKLSYLYVLKELCRLGLLSETHPICSIYLHVDDYISTDNFQLHYSMYDGFSYMGYEDNGEDVLAYCHMVDAGLEKDEFLVYIRNLSYEKLSHDARQIIDMIEVFFNTSVDIISSAGDSSLYPDNIVDKMLYMFGMLALTYGDSDWDGFYEQDGLHEECQSDYLGCYQVSEVAIFSSEAIGFVYSIMNDADYYKRREMYPLLNEVRYYLSRVPLFMGIYNGASGYMESLGTDGSYYCAYSFGGNGETGEAWDILDIDMFSLLYCLPLFECVNEILKLAGREDLEVNFFGE